jgi:DNA polymerase
MLTFLHRDFETRSAAKLKTVKTQRYAMDVTTTVLCVCYAINDGKIETWIPEEGKPPPDVFVEAANNPDWRSVAHNDGFETGIEEHILGPRYGWPLVPIERHICTEAMALAAALPGELAAIAEILQLPVQKDIEGRKLMLELSKPRKARKGEDPKGIYWVEITPEKLARLIKYCCNDVATERAACHRLQQLPIFEQKVWQIDARINARGFRTDLELAAAARKIVQAEQARINAKASTLSGGAITTIHQRDRIIAYVNERGHNLQRLNKRAVATALAHEPDAETRKILELRREGARASVEKLDTLFASVCDDLRVRSVLRYYGSHTGRWTGAGFQPQNLKKPSIKSITAAIAAVRSGKLENVQALGDPISIIADISRAIIVAAPGNVLEAGDFSAIESRILAWVANETWKLEAYREFDRTGDPKLEPYCVIASRVLGREVAPANEADRERGKTQDLAFGFGGSVGAWRRFVPDDPRSDNEIYAQEVVPFRKMHPATVQFWAQLAYAMKECVRFRKPVQRDKFSCDFVGEDLHLILPSGRHLYYPKARLDVAKYGNYEIYFHSKTKGWQEIVTWHGTLTENLVQAVARDLLANALVNLDAAGLEPVLHVHDEIVVEIAQTSANRNEFLQLMTTPPAWATGLPIAAKTRTSERYIKSDAPTEVIEPPPPPISEPPPPTPREAPELPPPPPQYNGMQRDISSEIHIVSLQDIVGEPLTNGKVRCPFHDDDTPSCHIYRDHYHCFSCGAHGDAISWLMEVEGLNYTAAREAFDTWEPSAQPQPEDDDKKTLQAALELWEEARPITGTLAAQYLTSRHIDIDQLPTAAPLRFHPCCPFKGGVRHPCLLALFRDIENDAPAGIHRIALTRDAQKIHRRMLGRWPGRRAIKLWPAGSTLVVGEGIETTAAAATRLLYENEPLRPAWALGSADALRNFNPVDGVERLIVLVDNDPHGQLAAQTCAERWADSERTTILLTPNRVGEDFNDLVRAMAI